MSDYTITTNFRNKTSSDLILSDEIAAEYENIKTAVNSKLDESDNLSDLGDKSTARSNLDVYSTSEVDTNISDAVEDLSGVTDATTARSNLNLDDASADVDFNSAAVDGNSLLPALNNFSDITSYSSDSDVTIPSYVHSVYVIAIGAGGGGGGANDTNDAGGGGGGGAFVASFLKTDPGETLSVSVGSGGSGGGPVSDGDPGGDSSVSGTNGSVVASGGSGGQRDADGGGGGSAGGASITDGLLVGSGEDGEEGIRGEYGGAGGFGGQNWPFTPYYGSGGDRKTSYGDGNPGSSPAGGGGGARGNDYTGGKGGDGIVVIAY